jgi:glycosyltransferase involved in cell wall biosynthesis
MMAHPEVAPINRNTAISNDIPKGKKLKELDIIFFLDGVPIYGSGGAKIIYALINGLQKRGLKVGVLFYRSDLWFKLRLNNKHIIIYKLLLKLNDSYIGFRLNRFVRKILRVPDFGYINPDVILFSLGELSNIKAEYIIANSFISGYELLKIDTGKSKKILFTQIDETSEIYSGKFAALADKIYQKFIYRIFLNKDMQKRYQNSAVINVGVDQELFKLINPIEQRQGNVVSFILRPGEQKDPETALKVIELLKKKHRNIEIIAFGTLDRKFVPKYVKYFYKPSNETLVKILNKSSIFVLTSTLEGMPLPPLEAMLCGNAVISTDNIGIRTYAVDGYNALLVPVRSPEIIVDKVLNLITNSELRKSLAYNGLKTAKEYTYERMTHEFLEALRALNELRQL